MECPSCRHWNPPQTTAECEMCHELRKGPEAQVVVGPVPPGRILIGATFPAKQGRYIDQPHRKIGLRGPARYDPHRTEPERVIQLGVKPGIT